MPVFSQNQSNTGDTYLIELDKYLQDLRKNPIHSNSQVNQVVKNIRKALDSIRNSIDPDKVSYGSIKESNSKLDELKGAVSILLKDHPKAFDSVMREFDAFYQTTNNLKNNISNQISPIGNYIKNHPVRMGAILGALTGDSPLAVAFGTYIDKQKVSNERDRSRQQELLKKLTTVQQEKLVSTQTPKAKIPKSVSQTRILPKKPVNIVKNPIRIDTPPNPINQTPIGKTINISPEPQNLASDVLLNDGPKVSPVEELANIIDANAGKNLNTVLYDVLKSSDRSPELKHHAAGTLRDLGADDELVKKYLKKPKVTTSPVQRPSYGAPLSKEVSPLPLKNNNRFDNPKLKPEHVVELFESQVKLLHSMDGSLKKLSDKLTNRDEFIDESSIENKEEGLIRKSKKPVMIAGLLGAGSANALTPKKDENSHGGLTTAVETGVTEAVAQKVIGGGIAGAAGKFFGSALFGLGGLASLALGTGAMASYKVFKDADTINEKMGYGKSSRKGLEQSLVGNGSVAVNSLLHPWDNLKRGFSDLIHGNWKDLFSGQYDPSQIAQKISATPALSEQQRAVEQKRRLDILRTRPNMGSGALLSTGASLASSTDYTLPQLGSMARLNEGNNSAGTINDQLVASGGDNLGGFSYGMYQFSSKQGTMDKFLDYIHSLSDIDPETKMIDDKLIAAGGKNGARQGTESFKQAWRNLANNRRMIYLQQAFAEDKIYEPVVEDLKEKGLDLTNRSKELKNAVFELAIAGRKNANQIVDSIRNQFGGNLNQVSDAQLIQSFYNSLGNLYGGEKEREAINAFHQGNLNQAFALYRQSGNERNRFQKESQVALYSLQQEQLQNEQAKLLLSKLDQNASMKNPQSGSSNNTMVQQTNNQNITNNTIGAGLRSRQNDSTHQQSSQSSYYRN